MALQIAGWIGMIASASTAPFTLSAALFSFGVGCIIPCQAGFVAAIWGRARFGEAAGLLTLVAIFGPLLIPVAVGVAYDALGGYVWPMRAMGLAIVLPALAFAGVRPRVVGTAVASG